MPTLVAYGEDGLPETVQYQELPVLLLEELQRQRRLNRAQNERISELAAEVDRMAAEGGR
jgi:hypothetical protein